MCSVQSSRLLSAGGDGRPVYGMGGLDGLGGRAGGRETTSGDWDGIGGREPQPCQGEGRGFESRRPLSVKNLLSRYLHVLETTSRRRRFAHRAHQIGHAGRRWIVQARIDPPTEHRLLRAGVGNSRRRLCRQTTIAALTHFTDSIHPSAGAPRAGSSSAANSSWIASCTHSAASLICKRSR
jgi:hypothetical protein